MIRPGAKAALAGMAPLVLLLALVAVFLAAVWWMMASSPKADATAQLPPGAVLVYNHVTSDSGSQRAFMVQGCVFFEHWEIDGQWHPDIAGGWPNQKPVVTCGGQP